VRKFRAADGGMVPIRHDIPGALLSIDDDPGTQNFPHYPFICNCLLEASKSELTIPEGHSDNPFLNVFPGDHYRLISGIIRVMGEGHDDCRDRNNQFCCVDIGTHYGTSARVMLDAVPYAYVDTYDVVPWHHNPHTVLEEDDIYENGGRLRQHVANLKEPAIFAEHEGILEAADFIMCDGPKDGVFELLFFKLLSQLSMSDKPRWLFIDDIRLHSEILSWRRIHSPKIDLTSFGHFTGSGLVDISKGFDFR